MSVRLTGTVYKYWTCYIYRGQQRIRRYIVPPPSTSPGFLASQVKFREGVFTWKNSSDDVKLYWAKLGARRKEPLPSFQTFLSCWMLNQVNPVTLRHIRQLQTR